MLNAKAKNKCARLKAKFIKIKTTGIYCFTVNINI
jgi:hypothetical protein